MALNIPTGRVHQKAQEAAVLLTEHAGRKVSQVDAIEAGLDQLLASLRRDELAAELRRIGQKAAALAPPGFNWDRAADLYDEDGLPG